MNKTELVAAIAEKAELSKKDAEKALKAFTETVAETLQNGDKVQLIGFGTLKLLKELQEQVRTLRQKRKFRSLHLRHLSSRLVEL